MDSEENNKKKDRSRRSSILKPQKVRKPFGDLDLTEGDNLETVEKIPRRVSFANSNFVKPFVTDPESNTIWDSTYEEEVNHTDSTHSKNSITPNITSCSTVSNKTSENVIISQYSQVKTNVTIDLTETMDFTKILSEVEDSENLKPIITNINDEEGMISFVHSSERFKINKNWPDSNKIQKKTNFGKTCPSMDITCEMNTSAVDMDISLSTDNNLKDNFNASQFNMHIFESSEEETENFDKFANVNTDYTTQFANFTKNNQLIASKSDSKSKTPDSIANKFSCTKISYDDMEFTCNIDKLRKSTENIESSPRDANQTTTKLFTDASMELTCQIPGILKGNKNFKITDFAKPNFLQKSPSCSPEVEIPLNQRKSIKVFDETMDFTCNLKKFQPTLTKIQRKSVHSEDMEFTCQIPKIVISEPNTNTDFNKEVNTDIERNENPSSFYEAMEIDETIYNCQISENEPLTCPVQINQNCELNNENQQLVEAISKNKNEIALEKENDRSNICSKVKSSEFNNLNMENQISNYEPVEKKAKVDEILVCRSEISDIVNVNKDTEKTDLKVANKENVQFDSNLRIEKAQLFNLELQNENQQLVKAISKNKNEIALEKENDRSNICLKVKSTELNNLNTEDQISNYEPVEKKVKVDEILVCRSEIVNVNSDPEKIDSEVVNKENVQFGSDLRNEKAQLFNLELQNENQPLVKAISKNKNEIALEKENDQSNISFKVKCTKPNNLNTEDQISNYEPVENKAKVDEILVCRSEISDIVNVNKDTEKTDLKVANKENVQFDSNLRSEKAQLFNLEIQSNQNKSNFSSTNKQIALAGTNIQAFDLENKISDNLKINQTFVLKNKNVQISPLKDQPINIEEENLEISNSAAGIAKANLEIDKTNTSTLKIKETIEEVVPNFSESLNLTNSASKLNRSGTPSKIPKLIPKPLEKQKLVTALDAESKLSINSEKLEYFNISIIDDSIGDNCKINLVSKSNEFNSIHSTTNDDTHDLINAGVTFDLKSPACKDASTASGSEQKIENPPSDSNSRSDRRRRSSLAMRIFENASYIVDCSQNPIDYPENSANLQSEHLSDTSTIILEDIKYNSSNCQLEDDVFPPLVSSNENKVELESEKDNSRSRKTFEKNISNSPVKNVKDYALNLMDLVQQDIKENQVESACYLDNIKESNRINLKIKGIYQQIAIELGVERRKMLERFQELEMLANIEMEEEEDDENMDDEPPKMVSMHDKVMQLLEKYNKRIEYCKTENGSYIFKTMFDSVTIAVQFCPISGVVSKLEVTCDTKPKIKKPFVRYLITLYMKALQHDNLIAKFCPQYDILTLIDFANQSMEEIIKYHDEWRLLCKNCAEKSILLVMDEDESTVRFEIFDSNFRIWWQFYIELSQNGFFANDVKVQNHFSDELQADELRIKGFLNAIEKNSDSLRILIEKIFQYYKSSINKDS